MRLTKRRACFVVSVLAICLAVGGYIAWVRPASIIPPPGGYSMARLERVPEAHLYYPDAVAVAALGHEGASIVDGGYPASVGAYLGSQSSPEAIIAFYRERLTTQGWEATTWGVYPAVGEIRTLGWQKGDLLFRLAILRHGDPRDPVELDRYATPYRFDLFPAPKR